MKRISVADDPRFDALLSDVSKAIAAEQEREADLFFERASNESTPLPSPEHLAAMEALLERAKQPRRAKRKHVFLQWAASLILALCIGSVIFPTQAAAVLRHLRSFVYQVHHTHTEIHAERLAPSNADAPSIDEFTAVFPTYIPEGFVCTDQRTRTLMSMSVYKRGEQTLHFRQMFADNTGISLDTEDAYTETLLVNGLEALYVEKQIDNSVYRTLLYHDDVYIYLLMGSDITKQDLFKVAQSVPSGSPN